MARISNATDFKIRTGWEDGNGRIFSDGVPVTNDADKAARITDSPGENGAHVWLFSFFPIPSRCNRVQYY